MSGDGGRNTRKRKPEGDAEGQKTAKRMKFSSDAYNVNLNTRPLGPPLPDAGAINVNLDPEGRLNVQIQNAEGDPVRSAVGTLVGSNHHIKITDESSQIIMDVDEDALSSTLSKAIGDLRNQLPTYVNPPSSSASSGATDDQLKGWICEQVTIICGQGRRAEGMPTREDDREAREKRMKEEEEAAQEAEEQRRREHDEMRSRQTPPPPGSRGDGTLHIAFLQMGQGDCTIMSTPGGRVIMIDCGSTSTEVTKAKRGMDIRVIAEGDNVPASGKGWIFVAKEGDKLHFRIFNGNGDQVVEERKLIEAPEIKDIKKLLPDPWPKKKKKKKDDGYDEDDAKLSLAQRAELVRIVRSLFNLTDKTYTDKYIDKRIRGVLYGEKFLKGYNTIDVLILTHPDLDHYNYLTRVLDKSVTIMDVYHSGEINHYSGDETYTANWIADRALGTQIKQVKLTKNEKELKKSTEEKAAAIPHASDGVDCFDERGALRILKETTDKTNCEVSILIGSMEGDSNTGSLVVLVTFGAKASKDKERKKVMVCGDATTETEEALLELYTSDQIADLDVLLAPHHGSDVTSSHDGFVQRMNPTCCIISAPKVSKKFGHPSDQVVDRYLKKLKGEEEPEHDITCFEKQGAQIYVPVTRKTKKNVYVTGSDKTRFVQLKLT
jgi:beta-lactamase superfamily II metal-dependent hydrolase